MNRGLKYLYDKYEDIQRKTQGASTRCSKQCRLRARTKYELQLRLGGT
jgi:hypothetical protein